MRWKKLDPDNAKHSKRYWDNRNVPTADQLVQALKDLGLYKKPDAAAKARGEYARKLLKDIAEGRAKEARFKIKH